MDWIKLAAGIVEEVEAGAGAGAGTGAGAGAGAEADADALEEDEVVEALEIIEEVEVLETLFGWTRLLLGAALPCAVAVAVVDVAAPVMFAEEAEDEVRIGRETMGAATD